MKLTVLSSLLLALSGVSAADNNKGWSELETKANYVEYPAEMQAKADNQLLTYREDSFTLPMLRAFQAFPEDGRLNVWSLLKSINTRLHPLLWPRVQYYVDEGYEFGCRAYDEDTDLDTPVTSGHCHRHCLNQGRYCAPQTEDELPEGREGHDVVREVVRRLCMDDIYHAKDPRFIAYMEEFDAQDCFAQEHVRACSIDALEKVGMKFSQIVECLQEETYEQDVPHTILNRNMRHLNKPNDGEYAIDDLPMVTIDGTPIWTDSLTVNSIFGAYCAAFPVDNTPVACEMCSDCDDIRTCLWTLTCDGVQLGGAPNGKVEEQAFNTNANDTEGPGAGGTIFWVIILFLSVIGLVGAVYYGTQLRNRDINRKTKALQDAITSDLTQDMEDDEDPNSDYHRKRAEELLSQVAMGKYGVCGGEKLSASSFGTAPLC